MAANMSHPICLSREDLEKEFRVVYPSKGRITVSVSNRRLQTVDEEMKRRLSRGVKRGSKALESTEYTYHSIWDQSGDERPLLTSLDRKSYRYEDASPAPHPFPEASVLTHLGERLESILDWEELDKQEAVGAMLLLRAGE